MDKLEDILLWIVLVGSVIIWILLIIIIISFPFVLYIVFGYWEILLFNFLTISLGAVTILTLIEHFRN